MERRKDGGLSRTGRDIRRPTLVRWGAVLAGGAIGLALLTLLSALWFALGFGSEVDQVRDNLEWYLGISAVISLFAGGYLAGYLAGVRGWGPGTVNGLTLWGALLIIALTVGVPSLLNIFNLGRIADAAQGGGAIAPGVDSAMWATFWSILGAMVAAAIGGALGGLSARPAGMFRTGDEEDAFDDDLYGEREPRTHRAG
jgi:peptidoglycan/LPS O-acetylase OafA/YrhL